MSAPTRLGIDFGTSHTVAVLRRADGTASPLLFDGSPLLPSAVYVDADKEISVGRDAIHLGRRNPEGFEPNPKRRIDDGSVMLGSHELSVVELFAAVLNRVREECVRVVGALPILVTATHPAEWGPTRRLILEDAAEKAGFTQVRLVAEPVAAATYFVEELRHEVPTASAVVVHDFGGGTFDASVVARSAAGLEVRAVEGIADLGGVDMDEALIGHIGQQFIDDPAWLRLMAPDTTEEARHRHALYDDVRVAKERLSRHTRSDLSVPLVDKDIHVTRDELETIVRPLLDKAVKVTQAVIRAAKVPSEHIAGVFLVGGGSRMPLVSTMLHQATGIAPTVLDQPEIVVAGGATLISPTGTTKRAEPAPAKPPATIRASAKVVPRKPPPAVRKATAAPAAKPSSAKQAAKPPRASAGPQSSGVGGIKALMWTQVFWWSLLAVTFLIATFRERSSDTGNFAQFGGREFTVLGIMVTIPILVAVGASVVAARRRWAKRAALVIEVVQLAGFALWQLAPNGLWSSVLSRLWMRDWVFNFASDRVSTVVTLVGVLIAVTVVVGAIGAVIRLATWRMRQPEA